MGCDVHLHVEVKIKGTWYHYAAPRVERLYVVFAMMGPCGRAPEVEPISQSKGLPETATPLTRLDYEDYGQEAHGASWLGVEELDLLRKRIKDYFGDQYNCLRHGLEHGIFRTYLQGGSLTRIEDPYEDLRVVFWFDN